MARVFVSYRRADGAYGVGWLAERLRTLDSITGVETAFHDSALRAGDDFPEALDREIADSDLVLAVIGTEWLGERDDGSARIADPDDWIVREIASAFRQDTRVVPVLLDGAEHPLSSDVHPSMAAIARLHALPFGNEQQLGVVVEHVESHLAEIDHDRARRAGLDEPVTVPTLPRLPLVAALAAIAGVIAAIAGPRAWWIDRCPGPCPPGGITETSGFAGFLVATTVFSALAAGAAVVGLIIVRRLSVVMVLRWAPIGAIVGTALLCVVLITISMPEGLYGITSSVTLQNATSRFWSGMIANCAVVSIWAVAGLSPSFGAPRAAPHRLGDRVRTLGIVRDAERWAVVCLTAISTFVALNSALLGLAIRHADDEVEMSTNPLPNVALALFLVVLVFALHLTSIPKLREMQAAVERDLAGLPPRYRDNAAPRLIATAFDDGGWGFRIMFVLPLVVACIGAIAMWATT